MKLRHLLLRRKSVTNLDSTLKGRNIILLTKVCTVKAMVFPVVMYGCVWMWELNHKEGWAPKNWCFWTVVLEKILESPLNNTEIKPVNPKGNQPWLLKEGLILKLKLQYFDHLIWTTDSLEKILMLENNEGWVPKNWYFRIVVLEKTFESPLDSKEIKPVNPKGNQPWIFHEKD